MVLNFKLPDCIAHRGASGIAPENTLAAFALAADQGATWVELDANISADNTVYVHHDDTVDRCTNGSGHLTQLSDDVLNKLDAGSWFDADFKGEPLPTLESVIALLCERNLGLNLEVKPSAGLDERTADAVCDAIKQHWPEERPLLISSFSERSLQRCAQRLPQIPRGYLLGAIPDDWQQRLKNLDCQTLHCSDKRLDEKTAKQVTQAGCKLLCYTVNEPARATQLFDWGVSSVFTDVPAIVRGRSDFPA